MAECEQMIGREAAKLRKKVCLFFLSLETKTNTS